MIKGIFGSVIFKFSFGKIEREKEKKKKKEWSN